VLSRTAFNKCEVMTVDLRGKTTVVAEVLLARRVVVVSGRSELSS
jgi:hypothetical protein